MDNGILQHLLYNIVLCASFYYYYSFKIKIKSHCTFVLFEKQFNLDIHHNSTEMMISMSISCLL